MRKLSDLKVIAVLVCINVAFILWMSSSFSRRWTILKYLETKTKQESGLPLDFPLNITHPFHRLENTTELQRKKHAPHSLKESSLKQYELNSTFAAHSSLTRQCPDVLSGMTRGRWIKRNLTSAEQKEVDDYLRDERGAYHIPPTFQRHDGRCGDVPYEGSPLYKHMWFRAICNPKGSTPCCMHNKCISLSVSQCQCVECYDERPAVHAEYAKWQPSNANCEPGNYSTTEACRLLQGSSMSFVGDSFIRHVFAALVILLSGNTEDGALKPDTPLYQRKKCSGWHQVTGLICRELLVDKRSLCGGTVEVDYTEVFPAKHLPFAIPPIQSHNLNTTKSLIVLGLGIHDDFRVDDVTNIFLKPFLNIHQFWRRRPRDVATVVAAIKSFKQTIKVDDTNIIDLLLEKNNNYLNSNIFNKYRIFGSDFSNLYNRVDVNFSYDSLNIDKMEKKLNLSLSEYMGTNYNNTSKPLESSISNHDQNPKLVLMNSFPENISNSQPSPAASKPSNLLWVGTHAPGVLKSSKFSHQTHAGVLSYNQEIYKFLKRWNVPYVDTYSFTNGSVSFDGTHYGWGVNMLKVNMILTYIERKLKPDLWESG